MAEYLTTESAISEISFNDNEDSIELLNKNQALTNEVEQLQKKLLQIEFELNNQITMLNFENENLQAKLKSHEELLEFYKKKTENISDYQETENEDVDYYSMNAEEIIAKLKDKLIEKEREISRINDFISAEIESNENNLNNLINDYECEISKCKNEISNLEYEIDKVKQDANSRRIDYEKEIERYITLNKILNEEKEKNEIVLNSHINSLNDEIKAQREQIDSLEMNMKNKEKDYIRKCADMVDKHTNEINSILEGKMTQLDLKEKMSNQLKFQLLQIEKERDNLRNETCACKRLYTEQCVNMETIANENSNLKNQNAKLEEKLTEAQTQIESMKNEMKSETPPTLLQHHQTFIEDYINDEIATETSAASTSMMCKYSTANNEGVNLMDYNSDENPTLLKTKIKSLETEIHKLQNVNKLKECKRSNAFRLHGELEMLKKELKEKNAKIAAYESQIKDLHQKIQNMPNENFTRSNIRKSSITRPENFNYKKLHEALELEEKVKNLQQECKFFTEQNMLLKSEVEKVTKIKDSLINKLKSDLIECENIAAMSKVGLAQAIFEKESEVIKYKTLCKKMKLKLDQACNKEKDIKACKENATGGNNSNNKAGRFSLFGLIGRKEKK